MLRVAPCGEGIQRGVDGAEYAPASRLDGAGRPLLRGRDGGPPGGYSRIRREFRGAPARLCPERGGLHGGGWFPCKFNDISPGERLRGEVPGAEADADEQGLLHG